tara:strand:- start:9027 stop:10070 length:1044 start_codon:yes stop_codon:yes gene_type:complete
MIKTKKDLKKFTVSQKASISGVLKILEKNRSGICLILNKSNNKLIGILTDGDIRRLLLKGKNLSTSINNYINKKFIFSYAGKNKIEYEIILKKNNILQLPILNRQKKLIGIFLKENPKIKDLPNPIVIIAGGLGTRMGKLTKNIPKPMLSVKGKPIIENEILRLRNFGFKKIFISVNYLSEKIINYFKEGQDWELNISYLKENKKLGTAGPLSLITKNEIKKDFIVINGDLISNIDYKELLKFHKRKKYDVTLCVRNHIQKIDYGIVNVNKRGLNIIDEKPKINYLINSGIYVFKKKVLNSLQRNKKIDMNSFINLLSKKRFKIGCFFIYEQVLDIGNKVQYKNIKQ